MGDLLLDAIELAAQLLPFVNVGHTLGQIHLQLVRDDLGDVLLLKNEGNFVDFAYIVHRDDVLRRNLRGSIILLPLRHAIYLEPFAF